MATTSVTASKSSEAPATATRSAKRRPLRWLASAIASATDWLFGAATLIVGLAVLATIPVVQLLSLGYLLEVSGRVARTGRLREGFVGIRAAACMGRIAVGVLVLMIPLWVASTLRFSAGLIDPDSRAAHAWTWGLVALSVLALFQIVSACLRGGKLRHFLWPRPVKSIRLLARPGAYASARNAVWDFAVGLRLPYYFSLGLRGFVGALAWLVVPVSMLAAASRLLPGVGTLVGLIGGALLAIVLLYLPFVQARLAAENRLRAMFEPRAMRQQFVRAPVAFLIALACTLVLALPLYLLKIEMVPREAAWLPSLLFVVSIFPARLLSGWALARAAKREKPRLWFWRWTSRTAMLAVAAPYVLLVYFTQYLSWYGLWSLYEQHAFLVPVPFLGL